MQSLILYIHIVFFHFNDCRSRVRKTATTNAWTHSLQDMTHRMMSPQSAWGSTSCMTDNERSLRDPSPFPQPQEPPSNPAHRSLLQHFPHAGILLQEHFGCWQLRPQTRRLPCHSAHGEFNHNTGRSSRMCPVRLDEATATMMRCFISK